MHSSRCIFCLGTHRAGVKMASHDKQMSEGEMGRNDEFTGNMVDRVTF